MLEDRKRWILKPSKTKELLTKKISIDDLTEDDVQFDFLQKRVDIKIGLDIASMSLKHQVEQIILVSGDSDFVPASKLARREGIDFILDPKLLWTWKFIQRKLFFKHTICGCFVMKPKSISVTAKNKWHVQLICIAKSLLDSSSN